VLSKLDLERSNLGLGLGRKGDVVNKDRADDSHAVLLPDEDRAVCADAGEAKLGENLLKSLEPLPAALLQAIETLEQTSDPGVVLLRKALRLAHVNLNVLELTIEIHIGDVNGLELPILESGKGKDDAQSGPFGGGSKGLIEVDARALGETLSNNARLVTLDRTVGVALDLKHPSRANCLTTGWELDELPGAILNVRLHLLHSRLVPQIGIQALERVPERSGLRLVRARSERVLESLWEQKVLVVLAIDGLNALC
jgi:hypothetical protein